MHAAIRQLTRKRSASNRLCMYAFIVAPVLRLRLLPPVHGPARGLVAAPRWAVERSHLGVNISHGLCPASRTNELENEYATLRGIPSSAGSPPALYTGERTPVPTARPPCPLGEDHHDHWLERIWPRSGNRFCTVPIQCSTGLPEWRKWLA